MTACAVVKCPVQEQTSAADMASQVPKPSSIYRDLSTVLWHPYTVVIRIVAYRVHAATII